MSLFSDYIKSYNIITGLEMKKVTLLHQIQVQKEKANAKMEISDVDADAIYKVYQELKEVDRRTEEEKGKKGHIRTEICRFMQDELEDHIVKGIFDIVDQEGKSTKETVVFIVKEEPSFSTPEDVAFNTHRRVFSIHIEGNVMEL